MMAAIEKLAEPSAAPYVKSADALGGIELVSRQSEQIHIERVDIDGNFPRGLHGIRMEIDLVFPGDSPDFIERLDGAELVVGVHDGDESSFRRNRRFRKVRISLTALDRSADRIGSDAPILIYREIS